MLFTYDDRNRLIREKRQDVDMAPSVHYELSYTYDQLGNRRTKHDELNDVLTCYAYDTDFDPSSETWNPNVCFTPNAPLVLTRNNRLLEYREFGAESAGKRALLRTVRYWYDGYGLARHIVVKDEGYATYRDLNLTYTPSGQLWLALQQEWTYDSWSPNEQQVTILPAWEFRYDAPRQRYLKRLLEYDDFVGAYVPSATEPDVWTDYLGDQPYVDYDVTDSGGTPTAGELQRYLAALGVHGEKDVVAQGTPETYYHPDLTGSTTVTTDGSGSQTARTAYTAFGELVDANGTVGYDPLLAPPTRYQYDGGYGYESGLLVLYGANPSLPPITLQHVGARWYQPGIGRFVQRDPIGIFGGLNVYAYGSNAATITVDPSGHFGLLIPGLIGAVIGGVIGGAVGGAEGALIGATSGFIGGVTGGLAGLGGLGGAASGALGGAVGGAVGGAAGGYADGRGAGGIATDAFFGACVGSILGGIGGRFGQLIDDLYEGLNLAPWLRGGVGGLSGITRGAIGLGRDLIDSISRWRPNRRFVY